MNSLEPTTAKDGGVPDRCAFEMNQLDEAAAAVDAALQQLHEASQALYRCRFGEREVNSALEWNNNNDIDGGPLSRELLADDIMIQSLRKFAAEFAQDHKK